MANKQVISLVETFERALDLILARVSVSDVPSSGISIAIAYSGGLDSSVLLHLTQSYTAIRGIQLFAFHVHHGLSLNADYWQEHCERECFRLGVQFDARRVTLADWGRDGVEQAARLARYRALGELCQGHKVSLLLTAHHKDDQAETILLQLLRGAGVAGLSGMESVNLASHLLGVPNLILGRPLLDTSRRDLEQFSAEHGIVHIEDESNLDPHYMRNALRHYVMPVLKQHFPGFQERFYRSAQHAQSTQRLLNQLAAQDLSICREGECIDIGKLGELGPDRIDNVLRHWLALRGVRMPSTSWLTEMRTQLFEAKIDAQVRVTHPECEIRRHRNRIFITPRLNEEAIGAQPLAFRWSGEVHMNFPLYHGSLHFEPGREGVSAEWLSQQNLSIRYRQGGEKLKPSSNRPTKSLKHHYQSLDIPAWERLRLPVISTSSGQLLFAAGIGMNWRGIPISEQGICLRWEQEGI